MRTSLKTLILLLLSFIALIVSVKAQDLKDDPPIKVNTYLVNIPVIASDRDGRNIPGLTKENFIITQDGEKQPIEFFADAEAPVSIALMLDTSGSTRLILEDIKSAAREFIKVLRPEDRAMVVSFDGQYRFLSKLTSKRKSLETAVYYAGIQHGFGGFSMYDAMYDVVKNELAKVQGRKAIILLTDGGDYGKYITEKQIVATLTEADTVVYPIIFDSVSSLPEEYFSKTKTLPNGRPFTKEQTQAAFNFRLQFMNSLAVITGGKLYQSESKNFKQTFQNIADELKKQYLVGFYPQNLDDGKTHQIAVEVVPKEIVIRTKRRIQMKASN